MCAEVKICEIGEIKGPEISELGILWNFFTAER
jgi:hypothetical protein